MSDDENKKEVKRGRKQECFTPEDKKARKKIYNKTYWNKQKDIKKICKYCGNEYGVVQYYYHKKTAIHKKNKELAKAKKMNIKSWAKKSKKNKK